jgi:pentatricopeptide repeat protein
MRGSGFCPDSITYAAVLKACVVVGSLEIGESVEADLRKRGLLQRDAALGDALVDMYCKFHAPHKARMVFEELPMRNVGSWNTMMSGYVRAGLGDEALQCVRDMRDAGVAADAVTYVSILKACSLVGSLGVAEGIHEEAGEKGLSEKDAVMSNALLDTYCKCGSLERAREVFENLAIRSVVSWTSLVAGYAQSGRAHAAFELYRRMAMEGIGADSILYTVLLTACCHAGLVKQGEEVFREMSRVSGLRPTLEHYTCMVDLYGRTGRLAEAEAFVDKAPWRGHRPLFVSLLGSCREWRNVELGKWAFEQSV